MSNSTIPLPEYSANLPCSVKGLASRLKTVKNDTYYSYSYKIK